METITTSFVQKLLPERPRNMHKGQAGRVLILAGSKGMMGAAALAAKGALYSGTGLIKVAIPEEYFVILQTIVPEAMCTDRQTILKATRNDLNKYDAICMGPGLGVSQESMELINKILIEYNGPTVVDADAINCICKYDSLDLLGRNIVITPHPGEADRILDRLDLGTCATIGRENCVKKINSVTKAVVLLKGADTLITDGNQIYKNPTGNPGMATGGNGDVLSGIIVSLLGQKTIGLYGEGISPLEAAVSGAFIHGLAGDIAAENIGEYGMTSSDVADAISIAFKEMIG